MVKLLGESSIGSGVRRVEALVGADAYQFLAREHVLVAQLTDALKVRPEELPERVNGIVERLRAAEKEIERVRVASLLSQAGELAAAARDVYGVRFVGSLRRGRGRGRRTQARARHPRPDARRRPGRGHVVGAADGKPTVVVALNDTARELAAQAAGGLVRVAASTLGGSGGGKDDVAQGGGTDAQAGPTGARKTSSARSPSG